MTPRKPRKPKPKPWWHSKTHWFNGITVTLCIVAILSGLTELPAIEQRVETVVWLQVLINCINIVLRQVTRRPIRGME